MLVEIDPKQVPGFNFLVIQDELADLPGRDVDRNTPGFLSRQIRDAVREKAIILYAKREEQRVRDKLDTVEKALTLAAGKGRTDLDSNEVISLAGDIVSREPGVS